MKSFISGSYFGDLELILNIPRLFSTKAQDTSKLIMIPTQSIKALKLQNQRFYLQFIKRTLKRLIGVSIAKKRCEIFTNITYKDEFWSAAHVNQPISVQVSTWLEDFRQAQLEINNRKQMPDYDEDDNSVLMYKIKLTSDRRLTPGQLAIHKRRILMRKRLAVNMGMQRLVTQEYDIAPTEYGSPYKGVYFGSNKSKPSLSVLGSRIGSKNELKSPLVRSKRPEININTLLSSITQGIEGVQTKVEQTEKTLEALTKQLEGLVKNMLQASTQLLAIIQNKDGEYDTRQQIVEQISYLREQHFKRAEDLASTMAFERQLKRFQRNSSSSVILSQASAASPKQSLGIRPEIKIVVASGFTPDAPARPQIRQEAAEAQGKLLYNGATGMEQAATSGKQKPEPPTPMGVKQMQNEQLKSPRADTALKQVVALMNPKQLRLRLQRIESSASHGSIKQPKEFGSSSEFQGKSDQTIRVDKHPVIAPSIIQNASQQNDSNALVDEQRTQSMLQENAQVNRTPLRTQQTLERKPLQLPGDLTDNLERLDEAGMTLHYQNSFRFESSGRQPGILETQSSNLTAQLPDKGLKDFKNHPESNSNKRTENHEEIQGEINPVVYAKTSTFGSLRPPTALSKKSLPEKHTSNPPSVASRNPFMNEAENDNLDRANLSNSLDHENEMATIDEHHEQSDDDKNFALDLLKDMNSSPVAGQIAEEQAHQQPSKTQMHGLSEDMHQRLQTQTDQNREEIRPAVLQAGPAVKKLRLLEVVNPAKPSTSESVEFAENKESLSQDGDETIAKHTGRYTQQSVYRGLSPKMRLLDEADYPDFGRADSSKHSFENHLPPDFMDYDLQPKPSNAKAIAAFQFTSDKHSYRVPNSRESERMKSRGSPQQKPTKLPQRPHVLIKNSTIEASWERQTGHSSHKARIWNNLEVPQVKQEANSKKGMFLKKKREFSSPGELSAPISARIMNSRTAVGRPTERSCQVGFLNQPENRTTINLVPSPRIQYSGTDFETSLPFGRRQQSHESSQKRRERPGKDDGSGEGKASRHNSQNRKHP